MVEPALGTPIAQSRPAAWTGEAEKERELGLRVQSPDSKDVSEGSSVKSASAAEPGESRTKGVEHVDEDSDVQSIDKVRSSGPTGDMLEEEGIEGEDKAEGITGRTTLLKETPPGSEEVKPAEGGRKR